ncbi:MAG: MraY family glycosyltransferase [Pseudomonadota bacterium]
MSALLITLLAFGSTILCVAILKRFAPGFGLVDQPDERKRHVGAIPLVGGISIWLAFTICMLFYGITSEIAVLIIFGGLLVGVGAVDDHSELPARMRLLFHIAAALAVCLFAGIVVKDLGDILFPHFDLKLGLFAIPFTTFAIVAMINSANMSDGIDGLCGVQMLVPLAGLAALAGIFDHPDFVPLMALCGTILGFLVFNLRSPWRTRATVFLGDAGSNLLGFVLAWFLIDLSQGEDAILSPAAVLWFALLLIYDTVVVVSRRALRGRSPLSADREHLHHVFLLARFSVSATVLTLGIMTIIGVTVGITTTVLNVPGYAIFAAFILFGLLFLHWMLQTWSVMRFLRRSICRRQGERRSTGDDEWPHEVDRRKGDRRRKAASV